ncbi:hypothetical protein RDV64_01475 [Acuticoccus sp. MNP-M23]|uniref:hypothetical protein n=1 Tax=Acuticoccus sp. MNP-M23 TaxID=3072793 RepID=UPI0028165A9E|nr:hypothetical protein [Acuticoccus sp. MNP-M23]WMS43102.1 hypothetical protein RDV64_01475 [Acuticoccus sp. MNP-M23]
MGIRPCPINPAEYSITDLGDRLYGSVTAILNANARAERGKREDAARLKRQRESRVSILTEQRRAAGQKEATQRKGIACEDAERSGPEM